jgi:molecular chaperone Hsp33
MGDRLERFVFERARIRGELVRLDATWREVLKRREYPPVLRGALGELMAAAALLSATLKFEGGALILQIQGGGPVTRLVVECQGDLTLRATAHWESWLSEMGEGTTLRGLARGGQCVMTLDPGPGRQAYQSVVPLDGVTTSEVLERYMERSEQIETRLFLAADDERAAGLLIQKLPPGRAGEPDDPDLWDRASHLLRTLTRDELLRLDGGEILRRLFHQETLRVFESLPVQFGCRCSPERVAGVIRMLGPDEARAVVRELGAVEVACDFCRATYRFGPEDVEAALQDVAAPTPPRA